MATDIGTRIRLARERLHWSQERLATETGTTVRTVRNWERTGRVRNRQGAIEQVLGISLGDDQDVQPSSIDDALDRVERELAELRRIRREEGRGKGQDNDEPNGTRRAG